MNQVNTNGDPVYERTLCAYDLAADHEQLVRIVGLLLERLNLEAVLTNATKHGTFEIELRSTE
jgi:hypothetical protein